MSSEMPRQDSDPLPSDDSVSSAPIDNVADVVLDTSLIPWVAQEAEVGGALEVLKDDEEEAEQATSGAFLLSMPAMHGSVGALLLTISCTCPFVLHFRQKTCEAPQSRVLLKGQTRSAEKKESQDEVSWRQR